MAMASLRLLSRATLYGKIPVGARNPAGFPAPVHGCGVVLPGPRGPRAAEFCLLCLGAAVHQALRRCLNTIAPIIRHGANCRDVTRAGCDKAMLPQGGLANNT